MAILDFPQDTSQSPYVANGVTYEWDGQKWTASIEGGSGDSVSVHVGTNPPTGTPSQGDLWWQDEEARLYVYYTDDDSSQWVDASPGAGGSGGGGGGIAGITIQDQGVNSNQDATTLNFVGAGVDVTGDGSTTKTITITGGGGSGSVPSLNQVTAVGNMSDLPIEVGDYDPDNSNPVGSVWLNLYNNRGSIAVQAADGHDTESAFHVQNKNNGVFDINYDGSVNAARGLTNLNADGSAKFSSYVWIDRDIAASETALLIQTENDSGRVFEVATSGTTRIGGTMPAAPNITLNADGSAVFAGTVFSEEGLRARGANSSIKVRQDGDAELAFAVTQNSTLTTDSTIKFNGNGSAWFDGTVDLGDYNDVSADATGGSRLYNSGRLFLRRVGQGDTSDAIRLTNGTGNDYTFKVTTDGTVTTTSGATFVGTVTVGGDASVSETGIRIFPEGYFYLAREDASTPFQRGYRTDTGAETYNILASGRATFADSLFITPSGNTTAEVELATSNGSGGAVYVRDASENNAISLEGSSSTGTFWEYGGNYNVMIRPFNSENASQILIRKDGQARFGVNGDGTVNIKDIASGEGVAIYPSGQLYIRNDDSTKEAFTIYTGGITADDKAILMRPNGSASFASGAVVIDSAGYIIIDRTTGTQNIIEGKLNGTQTSLINADGSAMFASFVRGGISTTFTQIDPTDGLQVVNNNITTANIAQDGSATFNGNGRFLRSLALQNGYGADMEGGAAIYGRNFANDTTIWKINYDGSATFAGDVIVGDNPTDGLGDGARIAKYGTIMAGRSGSETVFAGYNSDNPNSVATSSIYANGSADFAGAVTAATVNGVNVANVGAALTSLKTAAAAATDLDALKAAIASALANF